MVTQNNFSMKTENKKSSKSARVIPDGFHSITPYLVAKGAAELIEFIENAFDGHVTSILKGDDAMVVHATMKIGNSNIMIADEMENLSAMIGMLYLYVDDVDSMYQKALDAGATSLREPKDEFYGDRSAGVKDAWGNHWWVATHIEDVNEKELKSRMEKFRSETVHT